MQWIWPSLDEALAGGLARQAGISCIAATLLVGREIHTADEARQFLHPSLRLLKDPLALGGMKEAVQRLEKAVADRESVLIFGDYDVDGVTSTVFLFEFLRHFGLEPRFAVPKRLEEGYGLSLESLERAFTGGKPDLLIAVDCGTGSVEEVAWLRRNGVSVVILDHHKSKEALPSDCVVVNPHVRDAETVPWRNLCSVGLVFKFCHAFLKVRRDRGDPIAETVDLRDFLDLVALGTVADLVQLEGENRILVKSGLRRLQTSRRPGLCALMQVAGLNPEEDLTPIDIGFRLGPRINASGRLDDATVPIQLLLDTNPERCRQTAETLDSFNRERQDIERAITETAEEIVRGLYVQDPGLIVHQDGWHAGVVGIVASRLARKFNRPSLVFGSDGNGVLKGSGRSVEGVNLVEVLAQCASYLDQWGGHPMAVGLTVFEENVDLLRQAFNKQLQQLYPEGLPEPTLTIDAVVDPLDLDENLLEELSHLAPFGQGNPEPVFGLKGVRLGSLFPLGREHYKFTLKRDGKTPLEGVAWNAINRPPPLEVPIELAVKFDWNKWRGVSSPRVTLVDWRA